MVHRKLLLISIIGVVLWLGQPQLRGDVQATLRPYINSRAQVIQKQVGSWHDEEAQALIAIVRGLLQRPSITTINGTAQIAQSVTPPTPAPIATITDDPWSLWQAPTISAKQFDDILAQYGSPAHGIGPYITRIAHEHQIDTAYLLFIFIHESTAATNPAWIGFYPDGSSTRNPGNIRCLGGYDCYKGFTVFPSWESGFEAMVQLLVEYRAGGGVYYRGTKQHDTITEAIRTWAPPSENDTERYVQQLQRAVSTWRELSGSYIEPIKQGAPRTSHRVTDLEQINAPFDMVHCGYWGNQPNCQHLGTDIAVDIGAPVYAPLDAVYITTGTYTDSARRGDYVMMLVDEQYELYIGHMQNAIRLAVGSSVRAGDVIGYGSDAVHVHVQLRDERGNLLDFMKFIEQ